MPRVSPKKRQVARINDWVSKDYEKNIGLLILAAFVEMEIKVSEAADGSRINLDKCTLAQLKKINMIIDGSRHPIDPKNKID
jgi:hypothetical protein